MKNENYIQSLIVDDNLKQIKLSFKADDQILNLLNTVNSFGIDIFLLPFFVV